MVNIFAARARLKRTRGKLDREAFLAARTQYVNPTQQANGVKGGRPAKVEKPKAAPPVNATPRPEAQRSPPVTMPRREQQDTRSLSEAQRHREWIRAKKDQLLLDKLEGQLIDRDAVERNWADIAMRTQNAVMGIPAQIVNRLPAEWRRDVLTAAEDETRKVLTALSDEVRSISQAA
jgi:phage terminase Nu1 subunit (DNA packaging protein)